MLFHPYKYDYELNKENKDLIDLPIEVLRIKDSGKCIYGNDISNLIDLPTREDIIKHHELSNILFEISKSNDNKWYESYIRTIENPNPRMITQIVLTNAMSDYYFYTNKNCSSKYQILKVIEEDLPDFEYLQLLQLCHKYRFNNEGINNNDIELMIKMYKTTFVNRNKTW